MRVRYARAVTVTVLAGLVTGASLTVGNLPGARHGPSGGALFGIGLALLLTCTCAAIHLAGAQRLIDFLAATDCPSRSRPSRRP